MIDYKLVPIEPTAEMEQAGGAVYWKNIEDVCDIYRAMLAAAPNVQGEPGVAPLVEALESLIEYIPLDVVYCRGDKCRELWCASCFGDEEAESYLVTAERHLKKAKSALAAHRKQGGEK